MKCLKNCIFMQCSRIRTDLPCHCFISKKEVNLGETCPYENETVTELNMEANYDNEVTMMMSVVPGAMTEKRFWYDFEDCTGAKIVDFKENKEYPLETIGDFRKIEKLLNEQQEQIQTLKATNGEMEDYLARLEEENEQLKFSDTITDLECEIAKLKKENEQLKSILKIYHKVANCRNCHYHDYDTLFGGYDDYEICNKGNDVSDGICSEWREH